MLSRFAQWLVHEAGVVSKLVAFVVVATVAGVLAAGLIIPFAGAAGLGVKKATDSFQAMPSHLKIPPNKVRSKMLAADGSVLATFYDENRVDLKSIDDISPWMRKAIVAVEDNRFYEHGAADLRGILRAFVRNQQAGGVSQGGSTLTQQFVKMTLLESARTPAERKAAVADTYARKLQELRYAIGVEEEMSKPEILRRYLNIAYFGQGAYGIQSAARHYFGVSAKNLTVTQAAMLAGMVRDPNGFDPVEDPQPVLDRRNTVLTAMVTDHTLSKKRAKKAKKKPLGVHIHQTDSGCYSSKAPFFCEYALSELLDNKELGTTRDERRDYLYTGGLTIQTSLDWHDQHAAVASVRDHVYKTDPAVGVISMVEPGTGLVKAMAQSRPLGKGDGDTYVNYNVGQGHGGGLGIQPGSTMKVFVLAAALEQGISLETRIPAPRSYTSTGPMKTCNGVVKDTWPVVNSTYSSAKPTLIEATTHSVNTVFAQLEERTGLCLPWKIATDLGVTRGDGSPLEQVKSFTLGVNEVTPLSMAGAYAAFAAHGMYCKPTVITGISDSKGDKIPTPGPDCKQVVPKDVADAVAWVLHQNMDGGDDPGRTAASLILDDGRQAGGKTGTNNDNIAVSFAGITPNLAAFAQVADVDAPLESLIGDEVGGHVLTSDTAFGGTTAGPIWQDAMNAALKGEPKEKMPKVTPLMLHGKQVEIPYVVGMSVDDAKTALKAAGLVPALGHYVDSSYSYGTIAQQSDYGKVGLGQTVYIYPSDGTPYVPPAPKHTEKPTPKPTHTEAPEPKKTEPPEPKKTEPPEPDPQPKEPPNPGPKAPDGGGDNGGGNNGGGDTGNNGGSDTGGGNNGNGGGDTGNNGGGDTGDTGNSD